MEEQLYESMSSVRIIGTIQEYNKSGGIIFNHGEKLVTLSKQEMKSAIWLDYVDECTNEGNKYATFILLPDSVIQKHNLKKWK